MPDVINYENEHLLWWISAMVNEKKNNFVKAVPLRGQLRTGLSTSKAS